MPLVSRYCYKYSDIVIEREEVKGRRAGQPSKRITIVINGKRLPYSLDYYGGLGPRAAAMGEIDRAIELLGLEDFYAGWDLGCVPQEERKADLPRDRYVPLVSRSN